MQKTRAHLDGLLSGYDTFRVDSTGTLVCGKRKRNKGKRGRGAEKKKRNCQATDRHESVRSLGISDERKRGKGSPTEGWYDPIAASIGKRREERVATHATHANPRVYGVR